MSDLNSPDSPPPQISTALQIITGSEVPDHDEEDVDIKEWMKKSHGQVMNFMANTQMEFIWSVANFGITVYGIGGGLFAGLIPWYYTFKFPVMVVRRYWIYKNKSWHWFLFDFCYFVNALLIIYLWIYPHQTLFCIVFSLCNGPLLFAIILFGNALVFHSVDKTTSLLIHITPSIITYILRWQISQQLDWFDIDSRWLDNICHINSWQGIAKMNECSTLFSHILYPFLFNVGHQLLYFIVIQLICRNKIVANKNSLTTYRYLFRKSNQNGIKWKVINLFGKHGRIYLFGICFVTYSLLTFIPTVIFYRYQWTQFGMIVFCFLCATRNGAMFYAKVYVKSKRTETQKTDSTEEN